MLAFASPLETWARTRDLALGSGAANNVGITS
jgi:hypothetical protein